MINLREIDHVVLRVKDIEAMSRFYCDVLGARHVAYRPQFGMTHLRAGASIYLTDPEGNIVELKGPSDGNREPPHGLAQFR